MALASLEEVGEGLDSKSLEDHLISTGCLAQMRDPLRRQIFNHASFSRPDEQLENARVGWEQQFGIFKREQLLAEIESTKERLMKDLNREDFELLKVLKEAAAEIEGIENQVEDMVPNVKGSGTAA